MEFRYSATVYIDPKDLQDMYNLIKKDEKNFSFVYYNIMVQRYNIPFDVITEIEDDVKTEIFRRIKEEREKKI